MAIMSDCIGCKHLIRVDHNRIEGSTKVICGAFPKGIPHEVLNADKCEGVLCSDDIGYVEKKSPYRVTGSNT